MVQDTLYFSSDINGIDNIYLTKLGSYEYYQLTRNAVGIQQFSIQGNEILYNILGPKGIEIHTSKLSDAYLTLTDLFTPSELKQKLEIRTGQSSRKYQISDADRLKNKFRIYAWNWNPQEGANAVSYTHLDVYKRQGQRGPRIYY